MKRNGRFALALHTLGHMAKDPSRMRTSSEIAAHVGTNPVVVRRMLAPLRKAGLVLSEKGHAGGWCLAKPAAEITFADIYCALGEMLVASSEIPQINCATERATYSRVSDVLEDLEQELLVRLSSTPLSELA